jgi:hypothetical protein
MRNTWKTWKTEHDHRMHGLMNRGDEPLKMFAACLDSDSEFPITCLLRLRVVKLGAYAVS